MWCIVSLHPRNGKVENINDLLRCPNGRIKWDRENSNFVLVFVFLSWQLIWRRNCYLFFSQYLFNLLLPQVRKNKFVEILPINVGCLGACTYCKTKHARGHLGSYTIDSLVSTIQPLHGFVILISICWPFFKKFNLSGSPCQNCRN